MAQLVPCGTQHHLCCVFTALRARASLLWLSHCFYVSPENTLEFMNNSSSSFIEDKKKSSKKSKGSFPRRVGEAKPGPFSRVRQVGFQGAEQREVLIFLLGKTQQKHEGW